MTDEKIEEIYAIADLAFRNGQSFFRVHIFLFKMTGEKIEKQINSEWYSFWQNLKQGYDIFEEFSVPPNVEVINGQYVFE